MIYEGDCLDIMPTLPDKSVDMILCDLHYGTTACKWDTIIPFEPLWKQYKRLIKDNGAIVLTASQPFTSALVMSNPGWFKYEWIWDKVQAAGQLLVKRQPMRLHENIMVFYDKQPVYNRQMTDKPKDFIRKNAIKNMLNQKNKIGLVAQGGVVRKYADDYDITKTNPQSILRFSKRPTLRTDKFHPTQKPVALFEYLIRTYTNEGDTVMDNCAGSGTTGVACLNTGRKYILIEKDPGYCQIIHKRIADHQPLLNIA